MVQATLEALTTLGLVSGVARSAPIYALVSASHVLGIALLVGPVLLADLRIAGLIRSLDERAVSVLRTTATCGVLLALLTGIFLFSAKPLDYAGNRIVWAKLAVVAAALINAAVFEFRARRRGLPALLDGQGRRAALLSITLWIVALLLGRWIAFV
jgi:hypothetical protein